MGFSSSKTKKKLDKSFGKVLFTVENNGIKGTGFFCKLKIPKSDDFLPVLITNTQVYTKDDFYIDKRVKFKIQETPFILDVDDFRKSYISDTYEIAVLEVKRYDGIDVDSFLEIESDDNFQQDKLYKNNNLGLVTFNKEDKIYEALKFTIKSINRNLYDFQYTCELNEEFKGYPIININSNKIVGIHKEIDKINNVNNGMLLNVPITDFFDEIWRKELFSELPQRGSNIFKSTMTLDSTIILDKEEGNKEVLIIYEVRDLENKYIQIFGDEFVKKNKDKCELILYNEKKKKRLVYDFDSKLEIKTAYNFKFNKQFFSIILKAKEDLTDLSSMFKDCIHLLTVDKLSNINTEQVTTMASMFEGCENLLRLQFPEMKTSSLKDMSFMFKNCAKLPEIDLSGWNTSKVKTIKGIFQGCTKLKKLIGINDLDFSNVIDMSYSFSLCRSLRKLLDLSEWNTGNVITMESMFEGCVLLDELSDISKWKTSEVKNMSSMFNSCSSLRTLPNISEWDVSKVNNISCMFKGCESIRIFPNISNWNVSSVENMSSMFENCRALEKKPEIEQWKLSNLKSNTDLFKGCKLLEK